MNANPPVGTQVLGYTRTDKHTYAYKVWYCNFPL